MNQPNRIQITETISLPLNEISISATHSGGAGGQHVNKVATAIQLRFHIPSSSLPEALKKRLLSLSDRRLTKEGTLVIKAQEYKSQKQNRNAAIAILKRILLQASYQPPQRIPTKPSFSARQSRIDDKKKQSRKKKLRKKINPKTVDE